MRLPDSRGTGLYRALGGVTCCLAGLAALTAAPDARAAAIQWNGGFSQFWHQVFNWDPFGSPFSIRRIPTDIDTATLLTPAGDDVFLGGNTDPINGLTVGNGIELFTGGFLLEVDNAGAATSSIAGGGRIHVEPRVGGGNAFETDNLFLTGGGFLSLDGGDALVQGNTTIFGNSNVTGTTGETIHFGGNVSVIDSSVLRMLNGAAATFGPGANVSAEDGSIIDLEGIVNINHSVTFEFTTSARMEAENLNIGNDGAGNGSNGTLILDKDGGAGLLPRIDVSQNLTIGDDNIGTALMRVKDAQASIVGTTTIRATGTLELDGSSLGANDVVVDGGTITAINQNDPIFLFTGSTLTATNGAQISIDGDQSIRADGQFKIYSGSSLSVTGDLTVGTDPLGFGRLEVSGAGNALDVGGQTVIGENGFNGTIRIDGPTVVANTQQIDIGLSADGGLGLWTGATLNSTSARMGVNSGVTGSAILNNPGTLWDITSDLTVGSAGSASLIITNGARIQSASGFVGRSATSTSDVTIGLGGAAWLIDTSLVLGDLGGSGTIDIALDGVVRVGTEIELHPNGLIHLNGGTLTTSTFDFQGGTFQWTSGALHVETYPQNLTNTGGTLAPGESAGGTTILGDYTQLVGAAMQIEIGGLTPVTQHDQVSTTGAISLGGELHLALIDGFVPTVNDTFAVLASAGVITGAFSNVANGARLDTIDGHGSFLVHYGAGSAFNPNQVLLSGYLTTIMGDLNADGFVGIEDLNIVLSNWNQAVPPGDPLADPSGDGFVGIADLNVVLGNWNAGTPPGESANIPEPGAGVLLVLGALALGRRRVRR